MMPLRKALAADVFSHYRGPLIWGVLFGTALFAIWSATLHRMIPVLVLLAVLHVTTINFGFASDKVEIGVVPVVSLGSLWVVGPRGATLLLAVGVVAAELFRPLWNGARDYAERPGSQPFQGLARVTWRVLAYGLPLILSILLLSRLGVGSPLKRDEILGLEYVALVTLLYGSAHVGTNLLLWNFPRSDKRRFPTLPVAAAGFLSHPFALLGGTTYASSGMPLFIVYCSGVLVASLAIWSSYQRQLSSGRRLVELSDVNVTVEALREAMSTEAVIARVLALCNEFLVPDRISLRLVGDLGSWEEYRLSSPFPEADTQPSIASQKYEPDDMTAWVAKSGKTLLLDAGNVRYARQHDLALPRPMPAAWLAVPLTNSTGSVVGVLVAERDEAGRTFDRWQRELLLTVATQASSSIQNARLLEQAVRLYNLSDAMLAQRLEQLRALLDSMQEGVLMIDHENRIALINPQAAALLGGTASELGDRLLDLRDFSKLLGYEEWEIEELSTALSSGREPLLENAVSKPFPVQQAGEISRRMIQRLDAPVLDANGHIIGWLMLFRDVTEQFELDEIRAELTEMIVHDLRNPLTTLSSIVHLAQSRLEEGNISSVKDAANLLDQAMRTDSEMLDMVDSLLDISRLEASQPVVEADAMRLGPLAAHVMQQIRPLADQKSIELILKSPPDLPPVWGDPDVLRRVLINLLDNAVKYTPAGGRVRIRLESDPSANAHHEPGIRCSICDTGPGIPHEFRETIFRRFSRTVPGGPEKRGYGLGLAFCKLAIEAHGGRIWIEDGAEQGSCFVLTLPGLPRFDGPEMQTGKQFKEENDND